MPGPACLRRTARLAFLVPALAAACLAPPAGAQARARVLDLPLYEPELGRTEVPAYHPRKIVLELGPATPRPGFGGVVRPDAMPPRLASSGLGALDALHAAWRVEAYAPLFPTASPAVAPGDEDLTRYYVIELPAGASLAQALADYAAVPGVVGAEPVPILPVAFTPNDAFVGNQWQLGQGNDRDSDVFEAWDVSQGDTTIVIAIVDTGVQYNHADLGGTAAPYTAGVIKHNWIEMAGTPGVDDDGNGYVDDFRGWDFVAFATGAAGEDLTTPDNDPKDFAGHGTFCAGMASARTNNAVGIAGTAYRAKILPLRVGWATAGGNSLVDMSLCAQAIHYAANNGAHLVNCSWQSSNLSALVSAVTTAINRGLTICVAAGNEGTSSPPQNYLATRGDCIDIGATDSQDLRANFSNWGPWVDVSAAGASVFSTYSNAYTPTYAVGSGTSYSAPFVAGALALWQAHRKSLGQPLANPVETLLRVRDTGDDIDALNGGYAGMIGSRLNVHRLLTDPPTSWTNLGTGAYTAAPLVIDLDGDGDEEVVIGGTDQRVVAVTGADGDTLAGFPRLVTGSVDSNPAAWDVDLDGLPEILVGTGQGRLYAIRGDGSIVDGWPIFLSGDLRAGPAIADVDPANPGLECVVGSSDGKLWVLDRNGAVRPGWPKQARDAIYAVPALHDFDGDGYSEIVVGSFDSTLYAFHGDGTAMAGWPVAVGDRISSSAAIGDVDRDGVADIVVGVYDSKVHGYRVNGTAMPGWPVSVAGPVRSSPALADVAGNDGHLEVVVASDGPTMYVLDHLGQFVPGWPQGMGGSVVGSVVVGDVDNDGGLDIVAGASDKSLYIWNAAGTPRVGWPRLYDGVISGSPTLADPDDDGRTEILFGTETKRLRAVDLGPGTWNPALQPWPTMHRDVFRRGSVSNQVVDVAAGPGGGAGSAQLALAAAPNPAAATMRLNLRRGVVAAPRASDGVRIHSVTGRLVRTLALDAGAGRETSLAWDGADQAGRPVPAGLYFARARWGDEEASLRLVRLP